MQNFLKTLISENKNAMIPEELNYFGKLVGSWNIDYIDRSNFSSMKGEWHFSWVLDGMAIQDVIILPGYEYGTTLRVYNPNTTVWDIAYCYTGKIMRLEARKQDNRIVLTHIDNQKRKWVFTKIEDDRFHWQDVSQKKDGKWQTDFDIYAERHITK